MKNVFENNRITNEQLEQTFGKQLATGGVVIVHTEDTKNSEWKSIYLAQKRKVESRGTAPSGELSSIAKTLKGWDGTTNNYIVRHIETLNVKALQSLGLDVGSTLPVGSMIGVEDKNTPMTPNQQPIISREGEVRTFKGGEIYTHTFLTTEDEYAGDKVMKFDYVPQTETASATKSFAEENK